MIMLHILHALVCITIMGGARTHGVSGNTTIAKMEVAPALPPSSASQWWANAPLQQIDLRKIFDGSATTGEVSCDERTRTFRSNAHQAPLPGLKKSAVEKPRASSPNQLTHFATSSKQISPSLKNLKTFNQEEDRVAEDGKEVYVAHEQ